MFSILFLPITGAFLDPCRLEAINSSFQDETEDVEELPLIRHRGRRTSAGSAEPRDDEEIGVVDAGPPASPGRHNITSHPQNNGNAFASEEVFFISTLKNFYKHFLIIFLNI